MHPTRRQFVSGASAMLAGSMLRDRGFGAEAGKPEIVDIHQHTNYHGRSDADLIAHQKAMGVSTTILLPAGSDALGASTHNGKSFGLAARVLGNSAAYRLVQEHPELFVMFANEVTDLESAAAEIEKYLKMGARGIGEQKFGVECDSAASCKLFDLARAYQVPVLLHFQHQTYNLGFERFNKVLEKYPGVNFIAHAQTTWANIALDPVQTDLYPKGKVTPGGLTDRWLSDHPNFFADLSAGSGLNAFARDEEHGAAFFDRHQDKLLYGSDCQDVAGTVDDKNCCGSRMIAMIRKLVPSDAVKAKIFSGNAKRIIRIG
jgi:predicted TIM-barrel fold metal-dependent hydrolase